MQNEYYILADNEKTGPFTHREVIHQQPEPDTRIAIGTGAWQYASELPEFIKYFAARGIYFPTGDNLANFGMRMLAFIIDYFPLYVISEIIALSTGWVTLPANFTFGDPIPPTLFSFYLSFMGVFFLYRSLMESSAMKASIGKKICKLVVVDIDGRGPSLLTSLGRNFGVVLSIVLWVPFLTMLFAEYRQNWYDSLAKTYVIKTS